MAIVRKNKNQIELVENARIYPDSGYDDLPQGEGTTFQYFRDLIKAILEVDKNYYKVEYEDIPIPDEDLYERAFAYELYHQWARYVEYYNALHEVPEERRLCINGEIKKCFWDENKLPDLVLHRRKDDLQEIIVEIKRAKKANAANVMEDLRKLRNFTCGEERGVANVRRINNNFSPYRMGVFILTDATLAVLADILKNNTDELGTISQNMSEVNKPLYCVCIPLNESVQYATIQELIELQ